MACRTLGRGLASDLICAGALRALKGVGAMKTLAAALSGAAVAGFFVVMHADTPWFGVGPLDTFSIASGQVTIGPGQSLVIGTVPSNKHLVITDAGVHPAVSGFAYSVELDEQDASGTLAVKVPEGF